jgi:hypothetical protein
VLVAVPVEASSVSALANACPTATVESCLAVSVLATIVAASSWVENPQAVMMSIASAIKT